MKEGLEWLLEETKYTVAGRPIKLIIEDEGGADASVALEKAKKLATVDKVKIVYGPLHSGQAMATAPFLAENKVVQVGPMGKDMAALKWRHYILPWGTHDTQGMPLGWYAYDKLGYRKVVSLGSDYVAGHRFVAGAVEEFKKKGGTVLQQQWAPAGTADFGPYLTGMKEADAILTWLGGAELMRFIKQHKDFGVKMPVIQVTGDQLRATHMKELGSLILGAVSSLNYTSTIDNPANKKLVAAFQAKFGKDRNLERDVYCSYNCLEVILAGLGATKGDDSFEKLYPAILALKLDTALGPITFHPSGYGIVNGYIAQVKMIEGKMLWQAIHTYPGVRDPRL